jgi:hypothetical protein
MSIIQSVLQQQQLHWAPLRLTRVAHGTQTPGDGSIVGCPITQPTTVHICKSNPVMSTRSRSQLALLTLSLTRKRMRDLTHPSHFSRSLSLPANTST